MGKTQQINKNLGGNRLGSGNKNNVNLHAYNRSTHDMSRAWRSSMNVGTLVPCFMELGLNGDDFSINIENITRTIPSIGPMYGAYKFQIDFFECPLRLYNGLLHNNMTDIGLNMAQVKLPKFKLKANVKNRDKYAENLNKSQISKSSLVNYLGINGIGDYAFSLHTIGDQKVIERKFNAIPLIAYYDIYKNYYANKQEEKGAFICANLNLQTIEPKRLIGYGQITSDNIERDIKITNSYEDSSAITWLECDFAQLVNFGNITRIDITDWNGSYNPTNIKVTIVRSGSSETLPLSDLGTVYKTEEGNIILYLSSDYGLKRNISLQKLIWQFFPTEVSNNLNIQTFELKDIDNIRVEILKNTGLNNELLLNELDNGLLNKLLQENIDGGTYFKYPQHGLALKTYQSDIYNNWLQTEWIDGATGINKITAIDTSSGSFEIDSLILAKKIYNMLNRIAVSGGTYEDWQEAVYSVKAIRRAETPMYKGGLSAEIMFQEVISNAATEKDPLGTLAGKGGNFNNKGGNLEISCDEPCIILGIASITPRIDYSQGNSWIMTEIDSMDDLHKPQLDGIGFQDLLQERMAYWGTYFNDNNEMVKLAAGKSPAWLNYMTAVNETHGDFAEENKCMFMTLNRRYEFDSNSSSLERSSLGISDLTTYVDPRKYNYIFADKELDAQNFWVQLGFGVTARRVMSAKIIPYL